MDKFTRTEVLHFVAGTMGYKKMYTVHCAELLAGAMRAHGSTIAKRLPLEPLELLGTDAEREDYARIGPARDNLALHLGGHNVVCSSVPESSAMGGRRNSSDRPRRISHSAFQRPCVSHFVGLAS